MTDDEYLKSIRRGLKASVKFFESQNRQRREKHVVREFLRNLECKFLVRELEPVNDDPPDIRFRDCSFEIKEHMDAGRPRHRQYKEALEKANAATDPSDLLEHFTPKDMSLSELHDLVLADAESLSKRKYPPAVRREIDLLIYINLEDVMGMKVDELPDLARLRSTGWRSISFIKGYWSCVLTATDNASALLREAEGKLIHRKLPGRRLHPTRRPTRTRRKRRAG